MSYDLGTAHGTIELEYNGRGAVREAEHDMDRIERKSKDTDKSLGLLGKTLKGFGKGVALTTFATSMTSAAASAASLGIQVLGIVPNLVSISSLAAGLPAAFAGGAASAAVLTAAFAGVGDAIKGAFEADPKKFEKALEKLSPKAKEFAKSFREEAVPALKEFQQTIQDTFFKTAVLEAQIPRMVKALATLKPQLNGLAADFGEMTRRAVNFALSADSIGFFNDAIQVTRASIASLGTAIVPVLKGLRDVGGNGLPLMLRLADAVSAVATRFGEWLSQISADGRLNAWIDEGIATLKTLGEIVKNIGSILFSVISAANDVGGGLLNTIAELTGQFAAFFKTAEGATLLRDTFSAVITLARQLAPVITTLVAALGKALAPALLRIAQEVGPILLDVVQRLAPAFAPLANAIADLVVALAPLLPPIAQLLAILAKMAATVVSALVSELGPLISVISGALTQAFEALAPIIDEIARNGLPIAARAGAELARALIPLVPSIVQVAQAFADALIPLLPQLQASSEQLIPLIVELARAFVSVWNEGLKNLIPMIPTLVGLFVKFAPVALQLAIAFLKIVTSIVKLIDSLNNGQRRITQFWATVYVLFSQGVANARALVEGLAANILGVIRGMISPIVAMFRSLWNTARSIFQTGVNTVVSMARTLPGRVRSAIAALGSAIAAVARAAWNSFRSSTSSGIANVVSLVRTLPGRIRSALSNLGSLLISAGRQLMNGLIAGIQSGISRVLGLIRNLASQVRGAFNSAMKIFSPSRVMMESGVNIDEGLIVGLKKKMGEVARTATALAKTVIDPTISLPNASGLALAGVSIMPQLKQTATQAESGGAEFGPYMLQVDKKTLVQFTIDAITGNPRVVSKAAREGGRVGSWVGAGG